MNKLGIWAIAIVGAFVIGVLSANPVVDAAGGWKEALGLHEGDSSAHHDIPESQSALIFLRCSIQGTQICWTTATGGTSSPEQAPSFWSLIPTSGAITNLTVETSIGDPPIGTGESITIVLIKNDMDTSLTCVLAESDTTCSDTTNSVPVSFGDRILLRITANTAGPDIIVHGSVLLNS